MNQIFKIKAKGVLKALEEIMGNYFIAPEEERPCFGHWAQEMYKKRLLCCYMKKIQSSVYST